MHLLQNRVQLNALVNTEMNTLVQKPTEEISDNQRDYQVRD